MDIQNAGINRPEVENERVLQEKRSEPAWSRYLLSTNQENASFNQFFSDGKSIASG
jgi:hypothetical protein